MCDENKNNDNFSNHVDLDEVQSVLDQAIADTDKVIEEAKKACESNRENEEMEKVKAFCESLIVGLDQSLKKALSKLNELKENPNNKARIEEAKIKIVDLYQMTSQKVKEGYLDLVKNENIQSTLIDVSEKVKNFAEKGYVTIKKTVEDVVSNAKVHDTSEKAKVLAEQSIEVAKKTYVEITTNPKVHEAKEKAIALAEQSVEVAKKAYVDVTSNTKVQETVELAKKELSEVADKAMDGLKKAFDKDK